MSITVCSRKADLKSRIVTKYENFHGQVIQTMPVRELNPDVSQLTPLAKFIFEKMDGVYLGGFHTRPNTVFVKGAIELQWTIDVNKLGFEQAENMYKCYGINKNERASCEWLFSVIEPRVTDEEYLNLQAEKMAALAGEGGQIVCRRVIPDSGHGLNAKVECFVFEIISLSIINKGSSQGELNASTNN